MLFYKLDQFKNVVKCSAEDWINQERIKNSRRVVSTDIGKFWISTVLLPTTWDAYIFETMVYCASSDEWLDDYTERYKTYEEALMGHSLVVSRIEKLIKGNYNEQGN